MNRQPPRSPLFPTTTLSRSAKAPLPAADRELLVLADALAAAVVAPARVPLRVLVRRRRPDRLEDRRPREVLGRDQLDLSALALQLTLEEAGELGVDLRETCGRELLERSLRDGHERLLLGFSGIVLAPEVASRS